MADKHSSQTDEYGQPFRQIHTHQAENTEPCTEEQSERTLVASQRSDVLSIAIWAIALGAERCLSRIRSLNSLHAGFLVRHAGRLRHLAGPDQVSRQGAVHYNHYN